MTTLCLYETTNRDVFTNHKQIHFGELLLPSSSDSLAAPSPMANCKNYNTQTKILSAVLWVYDTSFLTVREDKTVFRIFGPKREK
jgi:hypothetical protein